MSPAFQVVIPPAFERDARRLTRRSRELATLLAEHSTLLEIDPYDRARRCDVTRRTDVAEGEGQWRLRVGDYRLRYHVLGQDVGLYSFRHRREAYYSCARAFMDR